ncbi:MAG TPA: HD domain-containing phosphohydrolase [Gemmatimonadales bacterium]|nr:HD domain-containing phosphohydrolase [Gemmatimonadales bacterium]
MSDIPLKTRVYTLLLVLITVAAGAIAWRAGYQIVPTNLKDLTDLLIIAGILLVMIVVAEVLDVSFPQAGQTFTVSVSAAFCFAAGLTIGPVLGGIVVALGHTIDGVIARRPAIKTTVNSAGMGLSTIASAALYFALAEPAESPIGSYRNLLAVILSGALFALINAGSLAIIVAPVVGISPFEMFRTNSGGLHVELLTLVTLGGVIPVLVSENPLSIILLILPLLIGPQTAFRGIQRAHHETRVAMEGLADALERRDPYTYRHSIRVTEHVRTILGVMPQIPRATAEAIIAAAHVHDLGKVGSRDGSLKKPGELSTAERQEIEQHPAIGAEIVSRLEAYRQSVDTIRHHHERWDGSGYPDGLEGERIPLGARIIAVADAFDAMTSDRVYRAALPVDVAFAELAKGRGTQFDPQIVDVFQAAYLSRSTSIGQQVGTESLPAARVLAPLALGKRLIPRLVARRPQAS